MIAVISTSLKFCCDVEILYNAFESVQVSDALGKHSAIGREMLDQCMKPYCTQAHATMLRILQTNHKNDHDYQRALMYMLHSVSQF